LLRGPVTGLPEPYKNHALVMVRFAEDMLKKTNYIVQILSSSLGEQTLSLALRVGLNSGSTTSGVLRGERARFQLFGDTVNTASLMESNGMAGSIHCSQSTADHWLVKRTDLIEPKGKGLMQTYWVKPSSDQLSAFSNTSSDKDQHNTCTVMEMKSIDVDHHLPILDEIDIGFSKNGSNHDSVSSF
jgi:Adenylate and Guanylate cyclase catalytic domain